MTISENDWQVESRRLQNIGRTNVIEIVPISHMEGLQNLIYTLTKHLTVDHEDSLPIIQKLQLPFSKVPQEDEWSHIMKTVNGSAELRDLISCENVKHAFESIYQSEVVLFPISMFRAQFPFNKRSVYGWHQDLGTWWLAENRDIADFAPYTMWLSISGASRENGIEFAEGKYLDKLENHRFVNGQGYFVMDNPPELGVNRFSPNVLPGHAVIFHPLLPHRSIDGKALMPRYSIDIRFCDAKVRFNGAVDWKFRVRRLLPKRLM